MMTAQEWLDELERLGEAAREAVGEGEESCPKN